MMIIIPILLLAAAIAFLIDMTDRVTVPHVDLTKLGLFFIALALAISTWH